MIKFEQSKAGIDMFMNTIIILYNFKKKKKKKSYFLFYKIITIEV